MKKILLIMPYGSVGGMERLALTFYNYYKKQGHEVKAVKLIRLPSDIINFGDDEIALSDIDFAEMPASKRALFYLNAPMRIRQLIRQHQITHSIAFGDMANVFSSLTFTREFKIASIHALKSVEFANPAFLNKVFKFAFRSTYKKFDKVVCISKAIKTDLLENCGFAFPEKLQVIYNPHDIAEINRKSLEMLDNDEENLFSGAVVLFLGRMSIQKSPWHLVKAFHLLKQKRPDAKLIFIGDGEAKVEAYVMKLIESLQLKDVHFLGRKSNPYQYLAKAKLLALTSFYEGTPNVIVEAIALGIPVVSSNCTDGITELMSLSKMENRNGNIVTESGIVTPNLFKGVLGIPADDAIIPEEIAIAEAMNDILASDEFKKSLSDSKAELLEKFDLDKVAGEYLQNQNNES